MFHAIYKHENWVNSRLLVVGSQTTNLIPDPSFGHNLCFRCPNGQCEPTLDIYVPRAFHWYKKIFKPLSFDPYNCPPKIQESIGTPTSKWNSLGVWGFIPSHLLTLPGVCCVTPGFLLSPQLCKPLPWSQAQG
jgi:hypothetical protein